MLSSRSDEVSAPDETTWHWPAWLGLAVVLSLFCAPLFIGLNNWDQRNDEAIYSYAVDRILETGEWLTPRSIPADTPFLEKPPLKFWLVAGAIRVGLFPFNDRGMRTLDAMLCAGAFLYVYLLGRRMAGPLAGGVSVLLLFSYDPLLFEHGVRGNNMEGMLMLAYCGGLYHFVRWAQEEITAARRRHAHVWMLLFVAAFLSKFVAAAFLPIICVAALAIDPARWPVWRQRWRDWIVPAAVAVVLIVPWFVYQTVQHGGMFWYEIVGLHVYLRFFGTLVVTHLAPWDHYFTQTWREFGYAQMQVIVTAGLVALLWRAWQRDWLARVALIWWLVPFILMSLGTSKLFYYAYPFLPPLALGGGLATVFVVRALTSERVRTQLHRLGLSIPQADTFRGPTRRQTILMTLGAVSLALAVATAIAGPITLEWDGVRLFRSSSAVRATIIGAVLWYVAGLRRTALTVLAIGLVAAFLPISGYTYRVARFSSVDHPLRTARDCGLAVQASGAARGVLYASGDIHHAYFYYLRHLGPWIDSSVVPPAELSRRLDTVGAQTPVILSMDDYVAIGGRRPAGHTKASGPALTTPWVGAAPLAGTLPVGFAIGDVVILLPGPYETCAGPAARAGSNGLPSRPAASMRTAAAGSR